MYFQSEFDPTDMGFVNLQHGPPRAVALGHTSGSPAVTTPAEGIEFDGRFV